MLLFHVPPSLHRLSMPRFVGGPGFRHVGLEYDLAAALRPELVVDLGAGDGTSFFAYCHSMHDHGVEGLAYAVDAWADAPVQADAAVDAQRAHARQRYPGFTYFVPMPPPEARRHFAEATIGLLRIDETRPGVIAGADVEAWYRRVKAGGVLAWHGASAAGSLWPLVAERCRSVVFSGGRSGLGIAMKPGGGTAIPFFELLFADGELPALEAFYAHVHEHHELDRLVSRFRSPEPAAP